MSAATPEKCPWCSEARVPLMGAGVVRYQCGSMIHDSGLFQRHPTCEVSVLSKRVAELEKERSWRPIQTCPHNLDWVLGYDEKDGETGLIIFDSTGSGEDPDAQQRAWTDGFRDWTPTHWMPLPEPPEAKGPQ